MGDMNKSDARWSELPLDILFYMVTSQNQLSFVDIENMGKVCRSWRLMLIENNWFGMGMNNKASFPWLMLSESKNNYIGSGKRGFFNPVTGNTVQVYLPEVEEKRCCGSGYGWIVTMGEDMEIKLLNPLTRAQLNLPSQLTFGEFTDGTTNEELHASHTRKELVKTFIRKAILTCSPSSSECRVVAFLVPLEEYQLAYTKPGASSWTLLPPLLEGMHAYDFSFYQGYLFGITMFGQLMIMDLYHDPQHKWKILSPPLSYLCRRIFPSPPASYRYYLAEIRGEIVVVARGRQSQCHEKNAHRTVKVGVFKYEKEEWCQVKDIGNCCLFLGTNQSICLSPVPRGYFSNSIYFTDDLMTYRISPPFLRGGDMVRFSLDGKEFSKFYDGTSLSDCSPPIWLILNT